MVEDIITIEKILELKGGSLAELRQYAQSKGIDLPNNLNYSLTPIELKTIDPILANKILRDSIIKSDSSKVNISAIGQREVRSQKEVFDKKKITNKKENKNFVDRKFIGIVKFFDYDKDFGFIASNNCNMPESKYKQDFYVNSISFIEDNAKKTECIVVFQIEKQIDGRKKAVNVRRISKSDEDISLALSYYGDYEYVEFKDGHKINLYCCIYKPVKLVAEKVKEIIIKDKERSPERTTQHFVFFIEHYKQDLSSKDRYIFDRDFSIGETSIWTSFFNVFTNDERIKVLSIYPSLCRYFTDSNLLHQWIDTRITTERSLVELQAFSRVYDFLSPELVAFAKKRIESIADIKIRELYVKLTNYTDIAESEIELKPVDYWYQNIQGCDGANLIRMLHSYLRLTTKDHEEDKNNCIQMLRYNRFKLATNAFISEPSKKNALENLINSFNALTGEKEKYQGEITRTLLNAIEQTIQNANYEASVYLLSEVAPFIGNENKLISERLFPLVKKELYESLTSLLSQPYRFENTFFERFSRLTKVFEENKIREIKDSLRPIILHSQSIRILSICTTNDEKWLSLEEALSEVSEIVAQWEYKDLANYINESGVLFDNACGYNDIIVTKALSIIGKDEICKPFGCQTDCNPNVSPYIQQENCSFLNKLKLYINHSSDSTKTAWKDYIKNRNSKETLILYKYNVISDLPEFVIAKIVNDITLDSTNANNERWYYKPVLKDKDTEQILANTDIDLFPIISARLAKINLSQENIPLAVLLTEIMTINRPQDDYYSQKTWDTDFENDLRDFRNSHIKNLKLGIILWAVHSKTPASVAGLKETFALLPPYLQIRSVKKLFQLISQGKLQYTAESLYSIISGAGTPVCFPLEITFAYLKRREKDPSKTLDNNIMLSLLNGRDDHPEWIGIRQLITQCHGRWQVKEMFNDDNHWRYFNGTIKEEHDNSLAIYVPHQMIDNHENLKNYNNKHFGDIQELIKITYDATEYCVSNVSSGIVYRFNKSYELDLFAIARAFNLKYNKLDHSIGFENIETQEDVFCECRAAKALDYIFGISFYWCGNRPCFRQPIRYMLDSEWENYTILDFMRILHIPTDYIQQGTATRFGHYILLSAYLKSFAKFYEHLKCRECGHLMKPLGLTNFCSRAVNEFQCVDKNCPAFGKKVYLNHCFNKKNCNATIDSRDSKQCPNGQYICPKCGACCSTENFRKRLEHLIMTGGYISRGVKDFIQRDMGHWEKQKYFCYRCGMLMEQAEGNGLYVCNNCKTEYDHRLKTVLLV